MRIRTRLTLWYTGVLLGSLAVLWGWSYFELVYEPRQNRSSKDLKLQDKDEDEDALSDEIQVLVLGGVPAALLALGGGWWLMRQALTPLAALTDAVQRTHDRNLLQQIPRSGNGDEIDRLTEVLNAMSTRLNDSFERIREFTLRASHELKTPLTILHGELETGLREEDPCPQQRDRMLSQLDEIRRLAAIVDGLTLLTKADAGQITIQKEPVQLDELVRDAAADAGLLGRRDAIQVALLQADRVSVVGDRHRLRQLLLNLCDNAVKYNQPQGHVQIRLLDHPEGPTLTFQNTGPGLPEKDQARVFDPFFQGEATCTSTTEGCGLGLSIAKWIVTAHGGTIDFASQPGGLTTVKVRFPRLG